MLILFICICTFKCMADSTVYFFVDFRFWQSEYVVKVNGKKGFKLQPEVSQMIGETPMYKMVARKVVFPKEDTYVISCDCNTNHGTMTAEINLNLEDGETYYVVFNAGMKNPFYAELLTEKDGLKLLKKAQKNKRYSFNKDVVYGSK